MKKLTLIIFAIFIFFSFSIFAQSPYEYTKHTITKDDKTLEIFLVQSSTTEKGINYFKNKKYKEGLEYFISQAKMGDLDCTVNAGIIYEYIEKDDALAMDYYKIAAEAGNPIGQYNYGVILYFIDEKLLTDINSAHKKIESYKWILCSAQQNYSWAIDAKEHMKKSSDLISQEEIKIAEKLSKDCIF